MTDRGSRRRPPSRTRRGDGRPRPDLLRSSRLWAFVPDEPGPRTRGTRGRRPLGGRARGARARLGAPRRRRLTAPPWWERLGADAAAELERRRAGRRQARRGSGRGLGRMRASAPRPVGILLWWEEQAVLARRAAALALGVLVVAGVVLALPAFHLQRVSVTGAGPITRTAVLDASGLTRGESMVFVRAGAAERRLLRLPGVRTAQVRIGWPNRASITLVRWVPVLVDVRAGLAAPVAPNGEALSAGRPAPALAPPAATLPRVVELGRATPIRAGETVLGARYTQALAALVQVFPRAFGVTVREFALTPAGSLLIYSSAGWVADCGPVLTPSELRGLGPRLEALRTLATRVDLARPGIAAIDLQDPTQVDVTDGRPAPLPAGGPPVLQASPPAAG